MVPFAEMSGSAGHSPDDPAAALTAVLWDMDGTLVNTEPLWMAAETELVQSWGGSWSHEDGLTLVGNPLPVSAAILQSRGVDLSVDEIIDYLSVRVRAGVAAQTPWQSGARELLLTLAEAGVPQALVTSSYRNLAQPFAEVTGVFATVVAGDDVEHAKPHPEPYLTAAAQLGVNIADCVIVEDSPSGIGAAVAAGGRVLAVEVFTPIPDLPGLSVTGSLTDVRIDDLVRIAGGSVLDKLH